MIAKKVKVAILISGRGSNMRALIEACDNDNFPAEVVLVLSNKEIIDGATGLEFAHSRNIRTVVVDHKKIFQENNSTKNLREEFDKKVSAEIEKSGAQIICLAGFMRILSPWFINRWFDRIINIHPSLLPSFKGHDAVGDAIKAGVKISGCTTHFVREEIDSGPIILQASVPVESGETKDSLAAKILIEEHKIYPKSLEILCQNFQKSFINKS